MIDITCASNIDTVSEEYVPTENVHSAIIVNGEAYINHFSTNR